MLNRRLGGLRWGCAQAWTKLVPGAKARGLSPCSPHPAMVLRAEQGAAGPPLRALVGRGPAPQSPRPHRHHPGVAQGLRIFCFGNANLTFQL